MPLPLIGGLVGVVKSIVGPASDIIEKFVGDPDKQAAAKIELAKVEAVIEERVIEYAQGLVEAQASVIRAEAEGTGLKAIWRPLVMLMFAFIVFNNYILFPYMQAIFGFAVQVATPESLWELMKLGLGGYVVGRSVEKTVKTWKGDA